MNSRPSDMDLADIIILLEYFASIYDPFAIASIEVNDTDGDQVIEANEEFELGLNLRNDMNYPDVAKNIIATMSVNSPFVNLISDSAVSLGTLSYLDEIQLPSNQFEFEVSENLEPGNVEFQIQFTWDEGVGYTLSFDLFVGHADVLLVRDEESVSVSFSGGLKTIQDRYLESLDTLGFLTNYWDLEERGDPSSEFIQNFPAVIWFTGADEENTLSENNQTILEGYLNNGGQLFLSGQDISDELAGSNFLENYLYAEHIQDTWYGAQTIKGIENDPIGNGQTYQINIGDAIANQSSMSVIEPLEGAFKSFGYYPPLDGAAVRYENDTYKTIFFAFGFEAIYGFNNRTDILDRILNDYFIMPHPCLPEGITFTTQEEIDNFETNYQGCIEVEGDVIIDGDDINNLNGLNVLTSIEGDLSIYSNPLLTSLSGLEGLSSIGGHLSIKLNDALLNLIGLDNLTFIGSFLNIEDNNSLASLQGLNSLSTIGIGPYGFGLNISDNDNLTNLSGLESLTYIEGALAIKDNFDLVSLTGLENLTSIGGYLSVSSNNELISLNGLNNLTSIGGRLSIGISGGNPALTSLAGLESLNSIGGHLTIKDNHLLSNIFNLNGVTTLWGNLTITNNDSLTSLSGLENIDETSIANLTITNNDELYDCDVWSICQYLINPGGTAVIEYNAPECNSIEEVEEHCLTGIEEFASKEGLNIYPNPLGSDVIISYNLEHSSFVTLKILDLSGKEMSILINEVQKQGEQKVKYNSHELKPGVYFCVLKTNPARAGQTKKIIKLD